MSLITGDNGLGKTFLLDCCWWALTGTWAGLEAYPRDDSKKTAISFRISGETSASEKTILYNFDTQSWNTSKDRITVPGLVIYVRIDGSFAVWDPSRHFQKTDNQFSDINSSGAFIFTKDNVWSGFNNERTGQTYINGLLRDWVTWQDNKQEPPFHIFEAVLEKLSPLDSYSDLGRLKPAEPMRLPRDAKRIPSLEHPYGKVPIVYASAGVRRIVTLAYLIVWAWQEHLVYSKLNRKTPQKRMVILVDEVEAHLHPHWQRSILSALLKIGGELAKDLQLQLLVATHSPLVLASIEPEFEDSIDKLFQLNIIQTDLLGGVNVSLDNLDFIRYGVVDQWLTSEVFKLKEPRSVEAEKAIEQARYLQLQSEPSKSEVQHVTDKLKETLATNDEFWPLWVFFARNHGAKL